MINSSRLQGWQFWLVAFGSALLAVVPRFLYYQIPFDRDEGAYAYVADVIQRGGLPYVNVFDHKPPLVFYFYHLSFSLFGHSVSAPRILAAVFVLVACLLLLLLSYRLTRNLAAAVFSCLLLGLASSSPAYEGFSANTEFFTLPFLVGGLLLLAEEEPSLDLFFYAGLLFGCGAMVKQPVAPIAFVVFAYHGFRSMRMPKRMFGRMLLSLIGFLLPLVAIMIFFTTKGEFAVFWKSSFAYNFGYVSGTTYSEGLSLLGRFLKSILLIDPVTWLIGLTGICWLFKSRIPSFTKGYIFASLIGAAAAISMGMRFYPHYFVFLLPIFAISSAVAYAEFSGSHYQNYLRPLAVVMLCLSCFSVAKYKSLSDHDFIKFCYYDNTMLQSRSTGDYLRANAPADSTLFIIGSEPEIFFYSQLRSASRICYLYPVMMQTLHREELRGELLADIGRRQPDYLVVVNRAHSLGSHTLDGNEFVNTLFRKFSAYRIIGMIADDSDTLVTGDRQTMSSMSAENLSMLILKRPKETGSTELTFGELLGSHGI